MFEILAIKSSIQTNGGSNPRLKARPFCPPLIYLRFNETRQPNGKLNLVVPPPPSSICMISPTDLAMLVLKQRIKKLFNGPWTQYPLYKLCNIFGKCLFGNG
jgi:hypothetical protein